MKLSTLSSLVIITLSLFQISCMQQDKKQDPYKEGDIVTWKINNHLILKAEVGQRREHSLENHSKRGEAEFYRPQYERYLGQFPIDYQPIGFDKISESEARDMPISKHSGRRYEFNLMLNGSTVQASDRVVESNDTLDHPDQVKVVINSYQASLTTKEATEKEEREVKAKYEKELSEKYGLHCRTRDDIGIPHCFGNSINPQVSGIVFSFLNDGKIKAISYDPIYGGIKVEWYFHPSNLQHWQEIDTAIWDLIETWNISPIE
ncbi:hypothetical protein [Psychrobacter fjordensis]|uniref:hypothetical protein n=1 Tax=Psychrobacter fjordensis TaxID=664424 RepID=UPI00191B1C98|nr:hypothetical protein [Psychrobacter fjordensis]